MAQPTTTRTETTTTSRLLRTAPLLLCLLVGALSACGEDVGSAYGPVVRDSAGTVIHEYPASVLERPPSLRLSNVPEVRIGTVEGAAEYQWTRPVAAARLSDGGFAVLEQLPAEVRVFDPSGHFLHRTGRTGDGPGEFRTPMGLTALSGDTLVIWDRGSRRLSWFSSDGTLQREQSLREPGGIRTIRRVVLSPGGAVVVLGALTMEEELGNQGRVREIWQLVPLEPGGDAAPPLGAIGGPERAIQVEGTGAGEVVSVRVEGRWWWGEGFAWASNRGVWTADQLIFEARHFDREQGLDRIVRIMAADRPFTSALIDSLHGAELERVHDPEIRELWRADFLEREYPQGVPPVAAVFGDVAGRVWIGLTDPPPERLPSGELSAVRRWAVFEEDAGVGPGMGAGVGPRVRPGVDRGAPPPLEALGILILPPRSHPLWADAEGVLLVRSDLGLDVAYIEWYPFVEG